MNDDVLFRPLVFPSGLRVKNRLMRGNVSGRIDHYDGTGSSARVRWEERFAEGGVGAILSAHVPVHVRGRILPNYAMIDRDERVGFWRRVVDRVHRHDCAFLIQLSHAGRQQDIGGVENEGLLARSSTSREDGLHGFPCRAMTVDEIHETIGWFAAAARRAKDAGADGVELHAANGYLFTQFLSSAINDRADAYGGELSCRARFLRETLRAVREAVGPRYHVQVKLSAVEHHDAVLFWDKPGNTLDESVQVARWCEEDGADALHVSTGSMFPHPLNPPGPLPPHETVLTYDTLISSGLHTFRNYVVFRLLWPVFGFLWDRKRGHRIEGVSLDDARAIKAAVRIPVLSTGGYQRASFIREAITSGGCDAVSIARPLLANPDLPRMFAAGHDEPPRPCTFCNKCLLHVIEDPLGCYEEARFDGDRERMMRELLAFFGEAEAGGPPEDQATAAPVTAGVQNSVRITQG
jgi:2,4-dienoyl-CoA reductase (NADPH2)